MQGNNMMMGASASDAAAEGFCQGPGRVMFPGFQFTFSPSDHPMVQSSNCVLWLFPNTVLDTAGKYAGALIGTFVLCVTLELLRAQRVHLSRREGLFASLKNKPMIVTDLLNTFSYIVQVGIAYWIMLLIMLYEAMFFIVICFGLGAGYFAALRMKHRDLRAAAAGEDRAEEEKLGGHSVTANQVTAAEEGRFASEEDGTRDVTCECTSPCCDNN